MANWWDPYESNGQSSVTVKLPPATKATPEQEELYRERGLWERFKDSYLSGALHNPIGAEGVVRYGTPGSGGRPKGLTDDQLNQIERKMSEDFSRKANADPAFRGGYPSQAGLIRGATDLLGGIAGGVDPTYILSAGKTIAERILSQSAINAGQDLTSQGIEKKRGVRDEINPYEVAANAAAGAVIQGGSELTRGAKTGRMVNRGMKHPDWAAVNDVIVNDLEGGGTLARPKVSPKGAVGPQQVMPKTARDPGFGIRPWNGKTQADLARVGRQYSAAMMDKYGGDPAKVLAAYNGGPGRIDKLITKYGDNWRQHLPDETKAYVRNGLKKLGNGSEDLGEVRMVRDEQLTVNDQTLINQELAPNRAEYEDVLTPTERQDMDASAAKPDVIPDNAHDYLTHPDQPSIPANDPKRSLTQLAKDLWNDESGAIRGDEPPARPEGEDLSPEEKLIHAVNNTRPASIETKEIVGEIKKNQAKRLAEIQARGGSLPEQLASLKGELPSVDYESVAHHFTPEEIKELERKINVSNSMSSFDKINTLKALHKMLNPEGLRLPTEHELDLLADIYSPELIRAILDRQKGPTSIGEKIANIGGIPRTIMSSTDISAPARQGLLFIGRKEFWKNYPKMLKMFFDPEYYNAKMAEIKERPNYQMMRQGKLAVRDGTMLIDREEYFISNMAENMPGENLPGIGLAAKAYNKTVGALVRASDRAYTGFLRVLRADVFDTLIDKGRAAGIEWESNPHKIKALANFINTSTGRGDLGKFENASQAFSTVFFAPRLMKGRFDILNPVYYAKLYKADPFIAKEAFKSAASLVVIAGTALGLAAAAGAKVEGDLRSADGLKIRMGNTRLDILGGIQQYLRLIAQMVSGSTKTQKGQIKDLTKGGYGEQTRWTTLLNFGSNKFAPIPGVVRDYLNTKNPVGEKFEWKKALSQLVIPMDISDTINSIKQNGPAGAWAFLPAVLGFSVQAYEPRESKSKSKSSKDWWTQYEVKDSSSKSKDWWKEYEK